MTGALLARRLAEKDKNGWRAVQKGNVLFAQGADHLRGVEPVLQPDARAEANKQRQQRRQRAPDLVLVEGAQAGLVGLVGYGLGVVGTIAFIRDFGSNPFFKGFYIPWQIPLISLAAVVVILALTGFIAIRSVLKTEPAAVFR